MAFKYLKLASSRWAALADKAFILPPLAAISFFWPSERFLARAKPPRRPKARAKDETFIADICLALSRKQGKFGRLALADHQRDYVLAGFHELDLEFAELDFDRTGRFAVIFGGQDDLVLALPAAADLHPHADLALAA